MSNNSFRSSFKRISAILRTRRIKANSWRYFESAVYNCARVSAINKSLAFAVCHRGIFGGPYIKQICRPSTVELAENADYVIVKDGQVYSMNVQ